MSKRAPRTNYKNLCLELEQRNRELSNQVEYLVRTIRDMDQEIWNMSQRTSWEAQRPHYTKLHEGMIARKHAENQRINDILRAEIISTYKPEPNNAPSSPTRQPPLLEGPRNASPPRIPHGRRNDT